MNLMFFCVISLSRLFPISFVRSFVCFYCVVVAVVSLCFGAYCCSTRVGAAVAAIFLWRLSVCVFAHRAVAKYMVTQAFIYSFCFIH